MGHQHNQHHHAHRAADTFDGALRQYIEKDPRFAKAVAENTENLLPRDAQSGDDYGAAPSGSSNGDSSSSSSSSSSTTSKACNSAFDNTCPTTSTSTTTIPIILGVVIPVSFFVIAMLVIWRIKKKRSRMEEAADKHASLDFGLGEVSRKDRRGKSGKRGKNNAPEMMDLSAEKQFRKDRGLSLEDMGSPYVLPGELNESRPSFHSMSRSAHDQEDPYRPVAMIRAESNDSRPGSRQDSNSIWTQGSDRSRGMKAPLIDTAPQASSMHPAYATGETPLLGAISPEIRSPLLPSELPGSSTTMPRKPVGQPSGSSNVLSPLDPRNPPAAPFVADDKPMADAYNQPPPTAPSPVPTFQFTEDPPAEDVPSMPPPPPKRSSLRQPSPEIRDDSSAEYDEYVTYADVLGIVQKESTYPGEEYGLGVQGVDTGTHRLSASIRPLPPDDPFDNPEDRANRIRSFYKEYFDEKRGTVANPGDGVDYYEDYNQEYLDGATVWDPQSGQFIVNGGNRPYAEPVTRRAMTPPPRAPPRFRGGSGGGRIYGSGPPGAGPRRPRGYSSASAAAHVQRHAKKSLPPPKPLNNLPTPHLLRDDSAIFNASEFAPPKSWSDRVAGRPESPSMDQRPYSPPSVRAFTPLVSSFDDLRVMPSPHALRRSGTFTGLDFAPPPKINAEMGSDAGSVRSGRSTTSRHQVANIRAGAYRVSRLPAEFVGTRNDLSSALKPTWDQRGPAQGI